jgi:peptidase A4-like protein
MNRTLLPPAGGPQHSGERDIVLTRKSARAGVFAVGAVALALVAGAVTAAPGVRATAVASASAQVVTSPNGHPLTARAAGAAAGGAQELAARVQPGGLFKTGRGQRAAEAMISSQTTNMMSSNWGGYVAERPGTEFRYVQATFFVPFLDCAGTPGSFSAHWVGLDGLTDATVEQDGILAACQGTTPVYAAWYEMFPRDPVYPHITIGPGHSIVASVYYSRVSRKFTLRLADTTNGEHFSVTRACPPGPACLRSSAEAISEAPGSGGTILPLSDFRAESYSGIKMTSRSGRRGGVRSPWWNTITMTTVGQGGAVLDQPTSVYRGTTFGMYWMSEN